MYVCGLSALRRYYIVGCNAPSMTVNSMKEGTDCDLHRVPIISYVNNGYLLAAATTNLRLPVPSANF